MTPAPESPDAARFDHDRLAGAMVLALVNQLDPEFLPHDIRDQARELFESGEHERLSDEEGERRILAVLRALIAPQSPAADTITRLTAERDAARRDAERLREALKDMLMHIGKGREDGVEWVCEPIHSDEIKAARAALSAQERGNV